MSFDYQNILNKNMVNVLKDILIEIENNGMSNNNHLYITFLTNHKNVEVPSWLIEKYPDEITIVIQYEYYNIKVNDEYFKITLSFNDVMADLKIGYSAIISFADPSANFGLKLQTTKIKKLNKNKSRNKKEAKNKSNVIDFSTFKNQSK